MAALRALAVLSIAAVVAVALLSGGSSADPTTPPPAPGQPRPFLGTAVIGSGGLTGAVDAYAGLVDLRLTGPAGESQISNSFERQAAGTVPADTGVVVSAAAGDRPPLPLWRGRRHVQRYVPGTNLLRTGADVGGARVRVTDAAGPSQPQLGRRIILSGSRRRPLRLRIAANFDLGGDSGGDTVAVMPGGFVQVDGSRRLHCLASRQPRVSASDGGDARVGLDWRGRGRLQVDLACTFGSPRPAEALRRTSAAADRGWLRRAAPLGRGAPGWATAMYRRSLLVMRALTDRRSGAVAAGARDGWAYVWPRDAGAVALALARSGFGVEARRAARFLLGLELEAGARFRGDGLPVDDNRALPGDATGWRRAAAAATGLRARLPEPRSWEDRGDYGERQGDSGDYLANAIAAGVPAGRIGRLFGTARGLVRRAGDPGSGLDSAAAWAVLPFARPALFGEVRRTLEGLMERGDRFGIVPAADWPYDEAWSAPTAWTAWSLSALGERREALRLMRMLRRAATPARMLPERVDVGSGLARSTTPLAWSHAFAVLALHELYPRPRP